MPGSSRSSEGAPWSDGPWQLVAIRHISTAMIRGFVRLQQMATAPPEPMPLPMSRIDQVDLDILRRNDTTSADVIRLTTD